MYPSLRNIPTIPNAPSAEPTHTDYCPKRTPWRDRIPANVVVLGLTSLFTDVSSEMITAILPLYLTLQLGFSPMQLGVFDGLYQVVAGLLRPVGGVLADRWRRYKEVAAAGYALSVAAKVGMLISGIAWWPAIGCLYLDRIGKGVRTAPRDALISLSTPRHALATAFGVHRALDTFGALMGPLVAFAILSVASEAFDAVIVSSLMFAIIGLAFIALLARNPSDMSQDGLETSPTKSPLTLQTIVGLIQNRRFRYVVIAGGLLSCMTVSDPLLYLLVQRTADFDPRYLPLLFSGTAVTYLLLAVPVGRLADRIGRSHVFMGGYGVLAAVYAGLWFAPSAPLMVVTCIGLFGIYYAATDGVLIAMTSAMTAPAVRSSSIAILTSVLTLARLGSSLLFGTLWSAFGQEQALIVFLVGLLIFIGLGIRLLCLPSRDDREAPTSPWR